MLQCIGNYRRILKRTKVLGTATVVPVAKEILGIIVIIISFQQEELCGFWVSEAEEEITLFPDYQDIMRKSVMGISDEK